MIRQLDSIENWVVIMIEVAYEQGLLKGDINRAQSMALRLLINWKYFKKYQDSDQDFENYYYGFMSFINPQLYDAIKQEKKQEEFFGEDVLYSEEDFLKLMEEFKE